MDEQRKNELESKWKAVVTRAVTDDEYKDKLCRDPLTLLREAGLTLPPEIQSKTGPGNEIQLITPREMPEPLASEAHWWKWRLNMIHEFGREKEKGIKYAAPEGEDDV